MTGEAKKIAEVFERCECGYCFQTCLYYGEEKCLRHLFADTADLIKRQDAEIQRLKALDRQGKWLNPDKSKCFYACSECGEGKYYVGGFVTDYCPNCGAKMDKEDDGDDNDAVD